MSSPVIDPSSLRWTLAPLSELESSAATWDAINSRAGGLPFMESRFLLPLLRHSGPQPGTLAIAQAGGDPVACALLENAGVGRMSTIQPSQLPLGAWLMQDGLGMEDVATSLLRRLPSHCIALGITQQDPQLWPRPVEGPRQRTVDYIQTAWIDVQGTYEAYWETRGKNLRSNLRKQRSKLASDNVPVSFERIVEPSKVRPAIAHFSSLESAGWKAQIGTAVSADSAQAQFYADMMESFCAADHGQIWVLRFGEQVVAVDLCIDGQGTLVILKTAYDPEFKSLSPSFLLKQEAFKQVFDEARFTRIEFYGRLMEWHTRWTENSRSLFHANLYRWDWVPRLRDWARREARPPVELQAGNSTPGHDHP